MTSSSWYVDQNLVVALRVDQQSMIVDATAGMAKLLGAPVDSLVFIGLADFCSHYLGGSVSPDDVWNLDSDAEQSVDAQLVDANGSLRTMRIQGGPGDGDSRTLLFVDITELVSTHDHLVRRMAHDRLLHLLVSDLLGGTDRDPDRVVTDVLTGFSDYFDLVSAVLTEADSGSPVVRTFVSRSGCERATFDRMATELPLIEAPDGGSLLDRTGPGEAWHVALDREDSYALGIEHAALTCVQVTVPYEGDRELSFVAAMGGRRFPPKADFELWYKALSHVSQYLSRATAEERIRRHGAIDEALATARVRLEYARPEALLDTLRFPAERLAAITQCSALAIVAVDQVDPHLRHAFDGWDAPRAVSPESLGLDPHVQGTWAVPVSDGSGVIALLTYTLDDSRSILETARAWQRLVELVPNANLESTRSALEIERTRDALTGLHNRAEIESLIAQRVADGEPITVTAIDLDHFNSVNASLGHLAGDQLLQLVAERLRLLVGPRMALARAGGDEFLIVSATASQQLAIDLANRILDSMRQPFAICGTELLTGASIGVVVGRGSMSPSELLLAASDALADAKDAGRNRVAYYRSSDDRRRTGLFESELRRAVRERSLEVYYQPEFDLATRFIVGAEALIRWRHPVDGLLTAASFVPLIEEIGLSDELCDYVLAEACAAAIEWRDTMAPTPFTIRINLSARDIEQPDIIDRVVATLERTGLGPESLCLEVTETAVMKDQRRVVQHLHGLAALGISLAIDDFGTGFSSLWLLRELPFDTLKIDQAFIAALDSGDPADRAIVETIVNLGNILGMAITAEGVETDAQFSALAEIGVSRAQGFLLARPQPRASLVENIARSNRG